MRKAALLAPALMAACAANPPVHGETAGHECRAGDTSRFVGEPATSETGAAILAATHAAVLRWAPHGSVMTMEYRSDRVTVYLDSEGRISRVACG
jgi:hypothetical protein